MGSVGAGLWNKRSFPVPVLGNAITSRIVSVLQRMDMRRSKPITIYREKKKETISLRYEGIERKEIGGVSSHDTATRSGCIVLEGKGEGEGEEIEIRGR